MSLSSVGGNQQPQQVGQSGHPNPAPVARTNPPATTRPRVAQKVSVTTLWKRFIIDNSTPETEWGKKIYQLVKQVKMLLILVNW